MAFATCAPTVFDKRHPLPVDAMISIPSSRRNTPSPSTRRPNRCGRGSRKWGGSCGLVQLGCHRQRRSGKFDEHRARVSDSDPRRHHGGGSRCPGRICRRHCRSAPGSRADGSRRPRGSMGTCAGAPRWWPNAPYRAGRASSHWLDLARRKSPAGPRRIFIERAYAVLARLPHPLLIGFAAMRADQMPDRTKTYSAPRAPQRLVYAAGPRRRS
jgi:hypothetical protein